jgi:CRP-like cAMP-binding protein
MSEESRKNVERREKARGTLRALYLGEAAEIGRKRADALREAEAQLDRLARLLPNAIGAGVALSEIARIAEISRPTLYQLRARYSDDPRALRLGVLQATAAGEVTASDIAESLGRPRDEVSAVLTELEERGWVNSDPIAYRDGSGGDWGWGLLPLGLDALEGWSFDVQEREEDKE